MTTRREFLAGMAAAGLSAPNVYTTIDEIEIDLFADKELEAAKNGIPS